MSWVMRGLHERNGLESAGDDPVTLIDAHHHLWDLDTHRYPWLQEAYVPSTFMGDYRPLRRNYLPEDYLRDSARQRVLATVHCEAEHARDDPVAETRWLHQQHARYGLPNAVVAHVGFHRPDCEETVQRHLAYPLLRGIRCKPVTAPRPGVSLRGQPGTMQDERWLRGLALLEKFGLSWDLRVPYWHLAEAAEVAAAFPGIPIALNHTGFPWDRSPEGLAGWRAGMERLARQANVHVKISELGQSDAPWTVAGNRQVVRETVAMFGIERCLFASNAPVSGLRADYDTIVYGLRAILKDLTEDQLQAFFWGNAARFYRIALH